VALYGCAGKTRTLCLDNVLVDNCVDAHTLPRSSMEAVFTSRSYAPLDSGLRGFAIRNAMYVIDR
jgi:hypothetical protein